MLRNHGTCQRLLTMAMQEVLPPDQSPIQGGCWWQCLPVLFCDESRNQLWDILNMIQTGWWFESQLGWLFPIYGKIKLMLQTTNQLWSKEFLEDFDPSALRWLMWTTSEALQKDEPICFSGPWTPAGFLTHAETCWTLNFLLMSFEVHINLKYLMHVHIDDMDSTKQLIMLNTWNAVAILSAWLPRNSRATSWTVTPEVFSWLP